MIYYGNPVTTRDRGASDYLSLDRVRVRIPAKGATTIHALKSTIRGENITWYKAIRSIHLIFVNVHNRPFMGLI